MTLFDAFRLLGWQETNTPPGVGRDELAMSLLAFRVSELNAIEKATDLRPGSLVDFRQAFAQAVGAFVTAQET